MPNMMQRTTLFVLFCFLVIVSAFTEIYLVYAFVEKGFTGASALAGFVNTSLLVSIGVLFSQMIRNMFLDKTRVPVKQLHQLTSKHSQIYKDALDHGQNIFERQRKIINATLEFAEHTLHGWIPGSHFELCIFLDKEEPLLYGYFDSNHSTIARSMVEREKNPHYYISRKYEVTRLLSSPTSQPRIIADTHDKTFDYIFNTDNQRKQLRSSIIICLDLDYPCALVISSNAKNAFIEADAELMSFIRFLGEQVHYDFLTGSFIQRIRSLRPELFTTSSSIEE